MACLRLRALRQILLGLVPLVVIALVLLVLMSLRLVDVSAPLRAATATAEATVTSTGLGTDGRQVAVEYTDESGTTQSGRLTLKDVQEVPLDEQLLVAYDPDRPAVVYARGDALTSSRDDLVNGLVVVTAILLVAVAVTAVRVLRRRRLTAGAQRQVQVRRQKYRRGLSERSWLVADADRGPVWVPVYWDPAVQLVGEDRMAALVHGQPQEQQLVAFEVNGVTVWPSGRRRPAAPKGAERELGPPGLAGSLLRQVRTDAVLVFFAPLLGLLWAYVDGSGPAGFGFATAMAVGVLFWLPSVYGSDPT